MIALSQQHKSINFCHLSRLGFVMQNILVYYLSVPFLLLNLHSFWSFEARFSWHYFVNTDDFLPVFDIHILYVIRGFLQIQGR